MKRIILFLIVAVFAMFTKGQQYDSSNSLRRKAFVQYQRNTEGYYEKEENLMVDVISDIVRLYAYNKSTREVYVETKYGNYVVSLDEENAKKIEKNKELNLDIFSISIPGFELAVAKNVSSGLAKKIEELNVARQTKIADSISREQEAIKQKEDSINAAKRLQEDMVYLKTRNWRQVPSGMFIECNFCSEFTRDNELLCFRIANDSIVWGKVNEGHLGLTYLSIHKSLIPDYFKYDRNFKRHCELFRDSLCSDSVDFSEKFLEEFNNAHLFYYAEKLKSIAPYGFFINWGWDYKYSLSFNFEYYNTNKKTIKYIEVFWVIKNDVGDTRKTGSFKGTGPLEAFSSASWNWDYSNYRIAGDATNMDITKVVLTYMDGTTKTIPNSCIIYEFDY